MSELTREEVIAKIAEAREDGKNPDLSGLDLSGVNLSRLDLSRVDLSDAILRRANLSGANLANADLSHADLSGARLDYASLYYAIIFEADLSSANLSGADLSYANLTGATLPDTDQVLLTRFGWAHIRTDYIRIGCQYHRVEEWRGFTDDQIKKMDDGMLAWWHANKNIVMLIVDGLKGEK